MSSNFQPVLSAQTIAPSGNWYIDLVMEDYKFFRCLSEVAYASTAATTGVSIDLFSGMGTPDVTPYGGVPYISRATVPAASAGIGPFYGDNSAAVTMVSLTDNDTANNAVVSFYADVS